jgi:hypothetical protein
MNAEKTKDMFISDDKNAGQNYSKVTNKSFENMINQRPYLELPVGNFSTS